MPAICHRECECECGSDRRTAELMNEGVRNEEREKGEDNDMESGLRFRLGFGTLFWNRDAGSHWASGHCGSMGMGMDAGLGWVITPSLDAKSIPYLASLAM